MSETKKPSNPEAFAYGFGTDNYSDIQRGMTLRDYFAAKALNSIISKVNTEDDDICHFTEYVAKTSYLIADEMLKQRELTEEK